MKKIILILLLTLIIPNTHAALFTETNTYLIPFIPIADLNITPFDLYVNNIFATGNITIQGSVINITTLSVNVTGNITLNGVDINDIFVNEDGDTMTGQLIVQSGNGKIVTSNSAGSIDVQDSVGDAGSISFGNTADIGISRDGVSGGYDYDGAFILKQKTSNPDEIGEFIFIEENGNWRFALPSSGAGYGTYNPRSMIISGASVNNASNFECSYWGFNNLDCDTGGTGADLGVQDDLEVLGTIFGDGSQLTGIPQLWNRTGTDLYPANIGDSVGIGTTTPQDILHLASNGITRVLLEDYANLINYTFGIGGGVFKIRGHPSNTDIINAIIGTVDINGLLTADNITVSEIITSNQVNSVNANLSGESYFYDDINFITSGGFTNGINILDQDDGNNLRIKLYTSLSGTPAILMYNIDETIGIALNPQTGTTSYTKSKLVVGGNAVTGTETLSVVGGIRIPTGNSFEATNNGKLSVGLNISPPIKTFTVMGGNPSLALYDTSNDNQFDFGVSGGTFKIAHLGPNPSVPVFGPGGRLMGWDGGVNDGLNWNLNNKNTTISYSGQGTSNSKVMQWLSGNRSTGRIPTLKFNDNIPTTYGSGEDSRIYWDGTNLVFDTNASGQEGLAWFSNNLSATGFNTRTPTLSSYNKDYYISLETPNNMLGNDGKLERNNLLSGESQTVTITDFDNCWEVLRFQQYCYNETELGGYVCEDNILDNYELVNVLNVTRKECSKKTVEVMSVDYAVTNNRLLLSEMKKEIEQLKAEIEVLKTQK